MATRPTVQTRYGEGHSFFDLHTLTQQICVALALRPGRLRGVEFRYIRHAMELTQAQIAQQFGRTEQTVANWEKRNQVPLEAGLLLKQNCLRKFGQIQAIGSVLDQQGKNAFGDARIVMEHDPATHRWRSNFHPEPGSAQGEERLYTIVSAARQVPILTIHTVAGRILDPAEAAAFERAASVGIAPSLYSQLPMDLLVGRHGNRVGRA